MPQLEKKRWERRIAGTESKSLRSVVGDHRDRTRLVGLDLQAETAANSSRKV